MNAFVIGPDGEMYKCWHEIGRKECSIGNVMKAGKRRDRNQRMHEIRWLTWEPFEYAECRQCKVLPICMGGACGYRAMFAGQNKPQCSQWRYGLEQALKEYYRSCVEGRAAGARDGWEFDGVRFRTRASSQ